MERYKFAFAALFALVSVSVAAFAGSDFGSFPGVTIRVAILSGDHPVAWKSVIGGFEALTGARVEIIDISWEDLYSKIFLELISHTGIYDIVELAGFWVPDFVVNGLLAPLDEFYSRWDWAQEDIVPAYRKIGIFGGHRYSVIADGDVFALYYRKDLFENPDYQAEFKAKYGYNLHVPATWDEYLDVAEFFNGRDTDGDGEVDLYGNEAMLSRTHGPMVFMQLLRSFGGRFFDPYTMEPEITGPAGRKAVETMLSISKYMPPGAASHDFTITRDNFTNGLAAMVVQWADVGSWSGTAPGSAVRGKVGTALVPAGVLDGVTYQRSELAWNWQWAINADSANKEAAAQLLRYMTSPEVSLRIISLARGYDPYRISHFENTEWAAQWFPGALEFLDGLRANLEYGAYDLYIPGAQQYLDVVGKHIGDIITGAVSLDEGLQRIHDEWNEITDRWGRNSQKAFYQDYLRTYWDWEG